MRRCYRNLPRLLVTAAFAASASVAHASEVTVNGGRLSGTELAEGGTFFSNIPYAAPPVGSLRWMPPQPVVPWQGLRDATLPSAPCLQLSQGWNKVAAKASKEDCLYLSIRSPRHRPGERLPVIFWVHGGSNVAGDGYGPARDAAIAERGVVVVAPEYRLGVFGFLGTPELTAESPKRVSGNYALLDLIAALAWVKANIAMFGGDPGNITLAGQSAGAADVILLTLSPLARGLFERTISESGVPGPPRSASENEAIGTQLPNLLHLPAGDLKALRGAAAQAVLSAAQTLKPPPGIDPGLLWGQQIVDGWVEPLPMEAVYARHLEAPVPMIIGNNTREIALDSPPDTLRALVREKYGSRAADVLKIYGLTYAGPTTDDPVLGNAGTQFLTDAWFRCPANWVARHLLATGLRVWRYEFGLPLPGTNGPVAHNAELKYVFDAAPPGATFATWPPVQQYWVNFAKSGAPDGPGLPVWPDMGKDLTYMAFSPSGPATGTNLRGGVCGADR